MSPFDAAVRRLGRASALGLGGHRFKSCLRGRRSLRGVTAREQLREQVEGLSEEQARDVLAVLASRRLIALHQAAPVDDEPEDEPDALAEARAQARRGETVSLVDARRELFGA